LREISEEIGDREASQTAVRQLGALYQSLQRYDLAIGFQQEDLRVARVEGDAVVVGALLLNLATATRGCGDYGQSIAWHEELLDLSAQMGDEAEEKWVFEGMAMYGLALVYRALNEGRKAIEYCDRALNLQHEIVQAIVERCVVLKQELESELING
jgi:tetratricopeptide (TPR) repeat protein